MFSVENTRKIINVLKGEQKIENEHKGILIYGRRDEHFLVDVIQEGTIQQVKFERISNASKNTLSLHLFICTEEGTLLVWRWDKEKWNFIGKAPVGYTTKSKIFNFHFRDEEKQVYSLELSASSQAGLSSCRLVKRGLSFSENGLEWTNSEVCESFKGAHDMHSTPDGLWVVSKSAVCFYEFLTKKTWPAIEIKDQKMEDVKPVKEQVKTEEIKITADQKRRKFLHSVSHFFVHANKELVALETSGEIVACAFKQNVGVVACTICKLQDFNSEKPVRDVCVLHSALALNQEPNSVHFFDLQTGFLLETRQINNSKKNFKNFWKQGISRTKESKNVPVFGFVDSYDGKKKNNSFFQFRLYLFLWTMQKVCGRSSSLR